MGGERGDRPAGGVSRPTVGGMASALQRGRNEWAGRSGRPAGQCVDEAEVVRHVDQAAGVVGSDATGRADDGRPAFVSFASLARIWRKWDLQPWRVETFSSPPTRAGRQGPRRSRAHLGEGRTQAWCSRSREVPSAGVGPDRADPAHILPGSRRSRPTATSGTAPPPCSPHWRSPPGRSPTPASPDTPTRVPRIL